MLLSIMYVVRVIPGATLITSPRRGEKHIFKKWTIKPSPSASPLTNPPFYSICRDSVCDKRGRKMACLTCIWKRMGWGLVRRSLPPPPKRPRPLSLNARRKWKGGREQECHAWSSQPDNPPLLLLLLLLPSLLLCFFFPRFITVRGAGGSEWSADINCPNLCGIFGRMNLQALRTMPRTLLDPTHLPIWQEHPVRVRACRL